MALNEKETFGASLVEPAPTHQLRLQASQESANTMSDTNSLLRDQTSSPRKEAHEQELSNPYSAFYDHSHSARPSLEQTRGASNIHLTPFGADPEAGSTRLPLSQVPTGQSKGFAGGQVKVMTMWPSRQSLKQQQKQHKKERRGWWNIFRNMNRKQKIWFRVIVVCIVVGLAVGLGVGISQAVGGTYYTGNGSNNAVPQNPA